MREEGSKHVFERVADVLARLGGDPRGARPRSRSDESDTSTILASVTEPSETSDDAASGRAVTDGGANGAPPGDVPWADDDPIVFGEGDDAEPGAAILDAVTDEETTAAPPFGDAETSEDGQPQSVGADPDAETVDSERLDELEARLDALEGDHVQLETHLSDVARGVASIREELSATGEDVRLLVAALGGIAIAREGTANGGEGDRSSSEADGSTSEEDGSTSEGDGTTRTDATDLAAALDGVDADDLAEALASQAESVEESGGDGETGGEARSIEHDDGPVAQTERDETASFDDRTPPEGIHRGAGEPPSPSFGDESGADTERPAAAESGGTEPIEAQSADGTPAEADRSVAPTEEAAGRTGDEPARELVDPRTEAVGARLRQFREGFVDDPTADLPTGNTADQFRFEKILLPTDGEEAPDLSNAELEKPYLEVLPDGYAADAVVLEWLDWLVSAADGEVAAQAVVYYESIDWLTAEVRDDLLAYLDGLGGTAPRGGQAQTDGTDAVEPPAALDLQDHLRSLQYVTELASGEVGSNGV